MRQPWTGLRDRSLPPAPTTLFPLRPSPQNPGTGDWQSSPVWRWRRCPMPVPGAPRAPIPKREFSKLALSTAPPSPRERFVAGGPSQHWNQRSPPSACWRLLAAARLPRPCRLNSPSVSRFRQRAFPVHVLYRSSGPPKRLPCKGGLSRGPPSAPCIPLCPLRDTDWAASVVVSRGGHPRAVFRETGAPR